MDLPILKVIQLPSTGLSESAPPGAALSSLAGILARKQSLVIVNRVVPLTLTTGAARVAIGPEDARRFQLPVNAPDHSRQALRGALDSLSTLTLDGPQLEALSVDAGRQIRAAWQLRAALERLSAAPVVSSGPLRVRIERVCSDGCRVFHVDQVMLRMICTWHGAGSEWLPEQAFDRAGLGCGCNDHVRDMSAIRHIPTAAVAVMKGNLFPGEQGRGLVHRSPLATPDQPRLLMVVDIA